MRQVRTWGRSFRLALSILASAGSLAGEIGEDIRWGFSHGDGVSFPAGYIILGGPF